MTESPVVLPRSTWWDMRAGNDPARSHRLSLAWPDAPPPPGGFPVLFVLDGNAGFATAVEAYRSLTWRGTAAVPGPALILGLGHSGEAPYDRPGRSRDYTPPGPGPAPDHPEGGAFLDFIEAELLPELERRFPVNRAHLALFGHSLGGLFAVHALLARPALFRRIVAASPSLWWESGAMMDAVRRFAANPPPEAAQIRVLVTVGALEESDEGPRGPIRAARRMIGHARTLAALLREAGLFVDFTEFPGEDHGSARPPALARAARFALPAREDLA